MKACFIYRNYLSPDGSNTSVGGIQTYLRNLKEVFMECGYQVEVYQLANKDFQKTLDGAYVYGFQTPNARTNGPKFLLEKVKANADPKKDIIVFGCETFACECKPFKSIGIQHGITWDQQWRKLTGKLAYHLYYYRKAIKGWEVIKRVSNVDQLICVDHNFVNWYRASVAFPKLNMKVIPNFSEIGENNLFKHSNPDRIQIIFARRFTVYRGTRVFGNAITKILNEFPNVDVTVAGDGEDAPWLHEKLNGYANVKFIKYRSNESLAIHADKHIAVIPTIGSEGTSLSLLEAMSSGCAVVCSDVGGMTDIVINGYNGVMIGADNEDMLYQSMKMLIEDPELRQKLARKGYETVCAGFSHERWANEWKDMIVKFAK